MTLKRSRWKVLKDLEEALLAQMPLVGAGAQILKGINLIQVALVLSGYIILLATSGRMVNYVLHSISGNGVAEPSREVKDTGYVIGKCENLLLLTFMLLDAFTMKTGRMLATSVVIGRPYTFPPNHTFISP